MTSENFRKITKIFIFLKKPTKIAPLACVCVRACGHASARGPAHVHASTVVYLRTFFVGGAHRKDDGIKCVLDGKHPHPVGGQKRQGIT